MPWYSDIIALVAPKVSIDPVDADQQRLIETLYGSIANLEDEVLETDQEILQLQHRLDLPEVVGNRMWLATLQCEQYIARDRKMWLQQRLLFLQAQAEQWIHMQYIADNFEPESIYMDSSLESKQ